MPLNMRQIDWDQCLSQPQTINALLKYYQSRINNINHLDQHLQTIFDLQMVRIINMINRSLKNYLEQIQNDQADDPIDVSILINDILKIWPNQMTKPFDQGKLSKKLLDEFNDRNELKWKIEVLKPTHADDQWFEKLLTSNPKQLKQLFEPIDLGHTPSGELFLMDKFKLEWLNLRRWQRHYEHQLYRYWFKHSLTRPNPKAINALYEQSYCKAVIDPYLTAQQHLHQFNKIFNHQLNAILKSLNSHH